MKYRYLIRYLLLLIFFSPLGLSAERWKQHPAMDDSPVRIVDTEQYTFFQVFQKLYSTTTSTHDTPVTTGLIYRKDIPDAGIVPMSQSVALHGGSIRTCEYSREGKFLAILYLDGGLDIVDDSGETKYNASLKNIFTPAWSVVNSMTISGKEIWIATEGGYLVIDGSNGQLLHRADIPENLKWVARCGESVIAFTANNIYQAEGDKFPRRFSDFSKISPEGASGNPQMLMPREDGAFFYLTPKESAGNYAVSVAYKKNGVWKNLLLRDIWLPVISNSIMLTNPFERTFTGNKEGWTFFTTADLFQLYNDRSPEAGDVIEVVPIRRKDKPGEARQVSFLGSWDGRSCVTYLYRGTFSFGEQTDGRMLIDDSEAIRPNVPLVAHATHLGYAPGHGTLAVNYGCSQIFTAILTNLPAMISAYKNGEWTLPNPLYNKPRSAEENPDLDALYRQNLSRFPITTPTGIAVDPLNPDYAWCGSTFYGFAAFNLADPKSDPLHFGAKSDGLRNYPGFKAIYEDCTRWSGYNPSSVPSFDGDGNLWLLYNNFDAPLKGESQAQLYCWKAKNREQVLSTRNLEAMEEMEVFPISDADNFNATMKCLATTHSSSRNNVFMYLACSPRVLIRLNHGGTLSDHSDDKIDKILSIEDQNGGLWNIAHCYDMKEDPHTGLIWLGEEDTLLCFDPTAEVKDGVIKGRVLDVAYGDTKGNPLSYIHVYGIAFDDSNRIWVTTDGGGIWGISADRKEVVAHYTAANSGLPHDTAYGIVWNPETQSLMISTAEGLAEVWPDLQSESGLLMEGVSVYPREIKPDYAGSVFLGGLTPGSEVSVCRLNGKEVKMVKADSEGNASWNLTDASGKGVSTGFYVLKGSFGEVEIAVMR